MDNCNRCGSEGNYCCPDGSSGGICGTDWKKNGIVCTSDDYAPMARQCVKGDGAYGQYCNDKAGTIDQKLQKCAYDDSGGGMQCSDDFNCYCPEGKENQRCGPSSVCWTGALPGPGTMPPPPSGPGPPPSWTGVPSPAPPASTTGAPPPPGPTGGCTYKADPSPHNSSGGGVSIDGQQAQRMDKGKDPAQTKSKLLGLCETACTSSDKCQAFVFGNYGDTAWGCYYKDSKVLAPASSNNPDSRVYVKNCPPTAR
jgi:hypothetical protein